MATDTTAGETICSSKHSTEDRESMIHSPELIKEESDDEEDGLSDQASETSVRRLTISDDDGTDEHQMELIESEPMDIEVLNNDDTSEGVIPKNSKSSLLDIDNIQILDDSPTNEDSSKADEETINISDSTSSEKSVDEENTTKNPVSSDAFVTVNEENTPANSGVTLKPTNIVVLNPKNNLADKQILSNDLLKGQRVFILNGNVISKEEVEKTKPDNINVICVSNNLNDIITSKSLLTPETSDKNLVFKSIEKFINNHSTNLTVKNVNGPTNLTVKNVNGPTNVTVRSVNGPKVIQIAPGKLKQISPISPKVVTTPTTAIVTPVPAVPKIIASKPTPPNTSKINELFRTKGLEDTPLTNQNQTSESFVTIKKSNSLGATKKDSIESESPAVAKARSEFNKCRKKLIEAAIHPQLPTYRPPTSYEGPIFSCEECDDTFSCTDSLRNHKNRRSVLFTYNCPPCNSTLEFYNRCTFLLHVRSHDAAVKACYLTISTIPSDKLNFKLLHEDDLEPPMAPSLEKSVQLVEKPVQPSETPVQPPEKPVQPPAKLVQLEKPIQPPEKPIQPPEKLVQALEKPTQSSEKSIQRNKDRVISRIENVESTEVAARVEVKENGTEKSKTIAKPNDDDKLLKNFEFIKKTLDKNKFEAYLQNTDWNKNLSDEVCVEEKSDFESSLSDDSSDDDNDSAASLDTPFNDTSSLNGSASSSRLKYFLTMNDFHPNAASLKRYPPNPPAAEETASKKPKVKDTSTKEVETSPESVLSKTKHTPIIIKTKSTQPKHEPVTEKPPPVEKPSFADEITLTSSDDDDDDEDSECGHVTDETKTVICRECRAEVTNLNKHIRAENKPLKEFLCEHCKFFSPSKCALQAHIRMHTKTQPYICPDCGFYFNTYETFQTHVKQVCYYDFKAIRFECPECSLLKPSVQAFADHLKRCHTRDVFKCSLCITSSYSTKVVDIHISKRHVGEDGTVLEGYRCMLCPNILISKKSIDTHINKHVFSLKHLRYVYICKKCKKYASGKRKKFVQHLSECGEKKIETVVQSKEVKEKVSPIKPTTSKAPVPSKPNRSRPSKSPGKKNLSDAAEKDPLSMEEWEADKLKSQYVPKTKICVMCRSADISSRSNSMFCNTCVCSVNADDTAAESSGGPKHDSGRPKRKFKCRLCKQFMNKDWPTITKHYEQDHHSDLNSKGESRSKPLKDKDKEKEKEKEKDKEKDKDKEIETKKPDNVTPVNIIKKRRLPVKETPPPVKSPRIEDIPLESPDPEIGIRPNPYICFHCKFTCVDRQEFKTHIVTHKDPNNTQCPECGQCFIIDTTLAKHVLIVHHVRSLRKYFTENGLLREKEKKPPARKKEPLKENQCDVCYIFCDSKQSYDKHIRTHGMAFVALQSRSKG
ncbi:zinc finger protein 532-like isoform X2 [Planococcus citri]